MGSYTTFLVPKQEATHYEAHTSLIERQLPPPYIHLKTNRLTVLKEAVICKPKDRLLSLRGGYLNLFSNIKLYLNMLNLKRCPISWGYIYP